jgi:hypothetical protein
MLNDGMILLWLTISFGIARAFCDRWVAKAARRADVQRVRRIRRNFYLGMFLCSFVLLLAMTWPGLKTDAMLIAFLVTFVGWFYALSVNPDLLVKSGDIITRYTSEKRNDQDAAQ